MAYRDEECVPKHFLKGSFWCVTQQGKHKGTFGTQVFNFSPSLLNQFEQHSLGSNLGVENRYLDAVQPLMMRSNH